MDTSELSQKIKHGIKWQAIISIISQVLYFVNGVILARILGPREFGLYGMAQIVSSFVWMFWQLGLNAAIIQRKEIDRAHLDTAFTISIVMGIICAIITWASAPFIAGFFREPKVIPLTRVIAFTFVIYAFDRVPSALLSRELKFKEAAIPGLLNALVYPAVAIPMALMGFGAMSFVWGVVAGAVAMLLVRYYWLFKYFDWRPRIYFEQKAAKDLLGFGVFLTLKSLLDFVLANVQKILVGNLGAEELGYFNRAANLSWLPLSKVQSVVNAALLPTFARIQDNTEKTRDWYRKFLFLTYLLVTPFLVFFIFFSRDFILFVFGPKWLFSANLLIWTSLGTLVLLPVMYWDNMINAKGLSDVLFYFRLVQIPVFATFLWIGVKYGVLGVVISLFLFGALFVLPASLVLLKKYVGVLPKDYFLSLAEPVGVILIIVAFVKPISTAMAYLNFNFYLKTISEGLLYGLLLVAYYAYRWFKNSYINYLGFDLKEVMKV